MSLGNEIHIGCSDCGSGLRHFFRTYFTHAVSPLTPVCLICFSSDCVLFPASLCKIPSLLGVGRLGVTFLLKGRVFTSIYVSVQGTYSFLSIIPWMSIRSYFLEVPDINESHLLKPRTPTKTLISLEWLDRLASSMSFPFGRTRQLKPGNC